MQTSVTWSDLQIILFCVGITRGCTRVSPSRLSSSVLMNSFLVVSQSLYCATSVTSAVFWTVFICFSCLFNAHFLRFKYKFSWNASHYKQENYNNKYFLPSRHHNWYEIRVVRGGKVVNTITSLFGGLRFDSIEGNEDFGII